jgi:toxin-antitoxin system PIN domain toxin
MTTLTERVLLDTNVLVYAMNQDAEHHASCRRLLDRAVDGQVPACLAQQILFEYFAVVTNAKQMPTPLTAAEAASDVEKISRLFPILQTTSGVVASTLSLARTLGVVGRRIFDLVLAATMFENGVTTIYTYDAHFANIPGVVALRPDAE